MHKGNGRDTDQGFQAMANACLVKRAPGIPLGRAKPEKGHKPTDASEEVSRGGKQLLMGSKGAPRDAPVLTLTEEEENSLTDEELLIYMAYPHVPWTLETLQEYAQGTYTTDTKPSRRRRKTVRPKAAVETRPRRKFKRYMHVPYDMVRDIGLLSANIFGIVWGYTQMDDGVCTASQATMAKDANCGLRTIKRHLKRLCDTGYIKCTKRYIKHAVKCTDAYEITDKGTRALFQDG